MTRRLRLTRQSLSERTAEREAPRTSSMRMPLVVAGCVLAVYAAWATAVAREDPLGVALIGTEQLDRGAGSSPVIEELRGSEVNRAGYDGQFLLFVALDPVGAEPYLDTPAYRYARSVYPLLARTLALGRPDLIPWTLILVNVLAAAVLTFCLAGILVRRGASAWYALIVGLAPGLGITVARDLTEPLAYALAALGMLLLLGGGRARLVAAAVVFALAGLTRETTLLFPLAAAICLAFGITDGAVRRPRKWRDAGLLATIAVTPALTLRVLLQAFLEGPLAPESHSWTSLVPLWGLFSRPTFGTDERFQVLAVLLPSLLGVLLILLAARRLTASLVALLLNVAVLVLVLHTEGWDEIAASARISLGVPFAFVLCLPTVPARRRLGLALLPAACWFVGWITVSEQVILLI